MSDETNQNQGSAPDPNTAFIIELVGGLFGLLGLGYFYVGRTNEGITRLLIFLVYVIVAWIIIGVLSIAIIGVCLIPVQIIIQIGVSIWSANSLKKDLAQIE
jgi:hypothetical protein